MGTGFKTSIKGKIFAIVLVSLAALVSAYFVNKFAFAAIRHSVEDLSHTNKKLIAVNNVFFEINESEKLFRNLVTTDAAISNFVRHSEQLHALTDTLGVLCLANPYQTTLIDSISSLLDKRQKVLLNYVDFRRRMSTTSPILTHARTLDSLFAIESLEVDSIVYSNEQSESITHTDTVILLEEQRTKGFLRRLFKPRTQDSIRVNTVVFTENNSKVDTIIQIRRNSILEEAQRIIEEISLEQANRRKMFLSRETALNNFENAFHNQITHLLAEIEKDITHQTSLTHTQAEKSISASIGRILIILGCFIFFSLIFVGLLLSDITRSNKYRQLLEKARLDAEHQSLYWQGFLSNMSHEIRTPLQAVIGYSEQLMKQQNPDESYIEIIHGSSAHLLQVINEVLDYNRISSGKFSFEQVRFNMQEVVSEVIYLLQLPAEKKGLLLLAHTQDIPADCFLEGDPFRLRQILLNLIGNAIKFTEKGKVVLHVVFQPDEDNKVAFTFTVSDTGPGIPFEKQEMIFNRFETIHLAPGRQYQGSGLGLSIAKALIEGQGGHISLVSEPGKGACFTFHISYPKATAGEPYQQQRYALPPPADTLVWQVDDDQLILQLCSSILKQYHIAHVCFPSATALLQEEASRNPSIFLVDIRMFDMNGFQLYDALRRKFPKHIPVIAVTAQALPEERYEILAYGFNDLLLKPFREEELYAIISKWTNRGSTARRAAPLAGTSLPDQETKAWSDDILQVYITETEQDIRQLHAALEKQDKAAIAMILHRMAGRTKQVGYRELGRKLRKLELQARAGTGIDQEEVKALIEALRASLLTVKP